MDKIIVWSIMKILVFLAVINDIQPAAAVPSDKINLFETLKEHDSLLFEVSFNKCNLEAINEIIAEDLEFYHDQSGITQSKEAFMDVMQNGICSPTNKTKSRRELVEGSLEVFPLYNNGELYGALQNGEHRFFESYDGTKETAGSIARFSHLWIQEDEKWTLKRVISYDHQNK